MPSRPIKGFIHPRDPRPPLKPNGYFSPRWSQLKDCFTSRGPDIFVGVINRPSRPQALRHGRKENERLSRDEWSNWANPHGFRAAEWGVDRGNKVYNFRTRRYEEWRGDPIEGGGLWSDVAYAPNWQTASAGPIMVRDAWDVVYRLKGRPAEAEMSHSETELWYDCEECL